MFSDAQSPFSSSDVSPPASSAAAPGKKLINLLEVSVVMKDLF
jgi:hypothetical protein